MHLMKGKLLWSCILKWTPMSRDTKTKDKDEYCQASTVIYFDMEPLDLCFYRRWTNWDVKKGL